MAHYRSVLRWDYEINYFILEYHLSFSLNANGVVCIMCELSSVLIRFTATCLSIPNFLIRLPDVNLSPILM